jgi:hypothetical protein
MLYSGHYTTAGTYDHLERLCDVAESNCSWLFDAYSTLRRLGLPVLPLHHTPHNLNSSPFVYRGDRRPSTGTHKRQTAETVSIVIQRLKLAGMAGFEPATK